MWRVFSIFLMAGAAAWALDVRVEPRFDGRTLRYDEVGYATASGQTVSVTRLDFLLSDFAFRRDGAWVELTNQFAFICGREGRTSFTLAGAPTGAVDRVRFHVGLAPAANHADPAAYEPGHPLHPGVNGLHWGWMGGYVFLAIEGRWRRADGALSGYSYHVANDEHLMTVDLPVPGLADKALILAMNVDPLFSVPLDDTTDTSHSRTNDTLAAGLRASIEKAFAVVPGAVSETRPTISSTTSSGEMDGATPYRFTFSSRFPRPDLPGDNPITEEGVALGRRLFSDGSLSVNGQQSCMTCHDASRGFSDGRATSRGAEGREGKRNAMSLFNLAWKSVFFWDGRAASLRAQVLMPIQDPDEMHESLSNVVAKLQTDSYRHDFARAFGGGDITADRVARALEQFLLVQVACNAKFDRVLDGRDQFTEEEQRGFQLFHTEYDPARGQYGADCFHCHGGPLFQSQRFANNGLDAAGGDPGLVAVTSRAGDAGKFAVPSLRNVERTAPYMHDGRFATLDEAVEHYCTGMKRSDTLDPNLAKHPDGGVPLSDADRRAVVAFLRTLTDSE
jgi:cytochrome c peroxidase